MALIKLINSKLLGSSARNLMPCISRNMGYNINRDYYWLERIGNREMVGYGMNGQPSYVDLEAFPFPAIRFKETTPRLQSLLEKQKGNWKLLTKEEKKAIYRANFRLTFVEFQAPTGEWMATLGYTLIFCSLGIWLWIFLRIMLKVEVPDSFKPSARRAQLRRIIDLQMNPITGICSNWDYEKRDWKVKRWNTPDNPFVKCPDDAE